MCEKICIRLPFFHHQINDRPSTSYDLPFDKLCYFSPLNDESQNSKRQWTPPNLPFSGDEVKNILYSLQEQNLAEMERIRLLLQQRVHEEEKRFKKEMAGLADFINSDDKEIVNSPASEDVLLRQAHLNLLWLWHQEEEYLEIYGLTQKCELRERHLLDEVKELKEIFNNYHQTSLTVSQDLLPDWKKILINSCIFIPETIPILLEGAPAQELLEEMPFNMHPEYSHLYQGQFPLWRLIGQQQAHANQSPFANAWNCPRQFYIVGL